MRAVSVEHKFDQLSLKDLVEARDHFHVHLMHMENVVSTALGRYRIRIDDPWPSRDSPRARLHHGSAGPRGKKTLVNSHIRPYSWPCILVFVKEWLEPHEFARRPADLVPPAVYMPDGRVVPICVVEAPTDDAEPAPIQNLMFPYSMVGGGYPSVNDVQGRTRIGSFGCLVTDGRITYAVTNRHVAGPPGEPVSTVLAGTRQVIGRSSDKTLSHLPFSEVYGKWPGKDAVSTLDVSLVEVADIHQWTAQVFGIGELGRLADLSIDNLSLRLIGCPVRANGAASGLSHGEIVGLFYRYKSVGGFDYIADFMIGPRQDGSRFATLPGDSGTLWVMERPGADGQIELMPLAVQWGGQQIDVGDTRLSLALGTCLSTVCRLLDVEVIRDWNIGHPEYWGAVGHYSIAAHAKQWLTQSSEIRTLMESNLPLISFRDEDISKKSFSKHGDVPVLSKRDYVPLADVPDLVWKLAPKDQGGRSHSLEGPNHFADMDRPRADGKTLLDLVDGPDKVAIELFQRYYADVGDDGGGTLPFRVWQFFDAMVEFAGNGQAKEFVAAAGALAHYVGDACQPLHCSYLHDGDPDDTVRALVHDRNAHGKVEKDVPRASGVHSAYEDGMVDAHTPELIAKIQDSDLAVLELVTTGRDAAYAVVGLMKRAFENLPPRDLVAAYLEVKGDAPKNVAAHLWDRFGAATAATMADGCRTLAMLWESAWLLGRNGKARFTDLGPRTEDEMKTLYMNAGFIRSCTLKTIGAQLGAAPPGRRQATGTVNGDRPSRRSPSRHSNGKTTNGRKPRHGHSHPE